jgi:hypothetical protein
MGDETEDNVTHLPVRKIGGHKRNPATRHGNGAGHGEAKGAGRGGRAKGAGYGGSANGAGNGSARQKFQPGNPGPTGLSEEARKRRMEIGLPDVSLSDEENARRLRQQLFDIVANAEHEDLRLKAVDTALDRVEGKSVQRNINANLDLARMSEADLEHERKVIEQREAMVDKAGALAPPLPPGTSGLVN